MQRYQLDSFTKATLKQWVYRFAIVFMFLMVWIVLYAALPSYRDNLLAAGLILGIIFYVLAIPTSLFLDREALLGLDTITALLVLCGAVFINCFLIGTTISVKRIIKEWLYGGN